MTSDTAAEDRKRFLRITASRAQLLTSLEPYRESIQALAYYFGKADDGQPALLFACCTLAATELEIIDFERRHQDLPELPGK